MKSYKGHARSVSLGERSPPPLPVSDMPVCEDSGRLTRAIPPAPELKIMMFSAGPQFAWYFDNYLADMHEEIGSYEIYYFLESTSSPNEANTWIKIIHVKADCLPVYQWCAFKPACFYYFAVRAVDVRKRVGLFSSPKCIRT